jgi:hypothetical protein
VVGECPPLPIVATETPLVSGRQSPMSTDENKSIVRR